MSSSANEARLLSIQVGLPAVHQAPDEDQPWRTGFWKAPVDGPVFLERTNLVGDGQAAVGIHGGPDKAVLAYAASHYPLWRSELGWPDLCFGAFAENFTLDNLTEKTVCLGDVYAVGEARVQVSQPRSPCWKIARRWRMPELTARVEATGRTGWYLRVLQEGILQAGQSFRLLERPHPEWSIARVAATARDRKTNSAAAAELRALAELSAAWRKALSTG
jgi:MOSC domain-containing protein YiiM